MERRGLVSSQVVVTTMGILCDWRSELALLMETGERPRLLVTHILALNRL